MKTQALSLSLINFIHSIHHPNTTNQQHLILSNHEDCRRRPRCPISPRRWVCGWKGKNWYSRLLLLFVDSLFRICTDADSRYTPLVSSITNQQRHLRYKDAKFIKIGSGPDPDTTGTFQDCCYSCFDDNEVVDSKNLEKNGNKAEKEVEDNTDDCLDKCGEAFSAAERAIFDTDCIYGCGRG